jgi:hypothetical protein
LISLRIIRIYAITIIAALAELASPENVALARSHFDVSPQSSTQLELTIISGIRPPAAPRTRNLLCDPTSGDHPRPEDACRDVEVALGNFEELPGEPGRVCGGVYQPVTASALGDWHGVPVRFERSYLNPCKMWASTGPVFMF